MNMNINFQIKKIIRNNHSEYIDFSSYAKKYYLMEIKKGIEGINGIIVEFVHANRNIDAITKQLKKSE